MFCQILGENFNSAVSSISRCLQSLLTHLVARWLFNAFNNTLVSCHCVLVCHSSICHVLPNTWRKFQFCSFLNFTLFAEPIDAFGSPMAIRCIQQHPSKLPLRACLPFQYLSCFAKYL